MTMIKVGTHSGTFHADEVLACAMLNVIMNGVQIIRTRDESVLKDCDYVVDVGGVYDHKIKRYDHHQRSFQDTFSSAYTTRLSSAGLVYKHYGKQLIEKVLKTDSPKTEKIFQKMYSSFIEAFDGIDNGVDRFSSNETPKYKDNTSISSIIGSMNGTYVEPEDLQDERFSKAMSWMKDILLRTIEVYGISWLPSREVISKCLLEMKDGIMILDEYVPWKSHVYELEEELLKTKKIKQRPLFCVYPDKNTWRVTCVSIKEGSFENRLSLPEKWRGLRESELDKASGVPGGTFVHASGFTGGNKTKEGLLKMLKQTLDSK
eukprot:NODE_365_length_8707_cov_1.170423.p5 type:complete len:318 gc:universal NODE_365_length_8707_cov_1.170423:6076-5123(-)